MNTSETAPDGVWFRNSPHTADTSRITGLGIYMNERVQASCYSLGDQVGRYGNAIWYYAHNITRPSVAGRSNEGWVNTHYVDDGMTANHAAPGVPPCGSAPTPPSPTPPPQTSVYFSPDAHEMLTTDPAVKNVRKTAWASTNCDTSRALGLVPASASVLSGWSLGRLGPIYALARANDAQRRRITSVLMIDPGSYTNLSGGCDNQGILIAPPLTFRRPSLILSDWLKTNRAARLVILSGTITATNAHSGIQKIYFNDMRAAGVDRSRVLVCNYSGPGATHENMYNQARPYLNSALTTCPNLPGIHFDRPWHP